jgi:hypothetical protein
MVRRIFSRIFGTKNIGYFQSYRDPQPSDIRESLIQDIGGLYHAPPPSHRGPGPGSHGSMRYVPSPRRKSHSCTTMYISLVVIYTGAREDNFTADGCTCRRRRGEAGRPRRRPTARGPRRISASRATPPRPRRAATRTRRLYPRKMRRLFLYPRQVLPRV